jgi:heme exporter protein D
MAGFAFGLLMSVILSIAVIIALVVHENNRTTKELEDIFRKMNEYNKENKNDQT